MIVGVVGSLHRFPVKSMAGESVPTAAVDLRGLVGDREWAVYTPDDGIASGKTSRRFRKVDGLLSWRSSLDRGAGDAPPVPVLHAPDRRTYRADDPAAARALADALGRPLTLRREAAVPHFDDCPIHLVSTSSIARLGALVDGPVDARRMRANVVIETDDDGFVEDGWTGTLTIGDTVVLRLDGGMPRCVMTDLPQLEVAPGPPVLRTLGREHDTTLGLMASVVRPGTIAVGDAVELRGA